LSNSFFKNSAYRLLDVLTHRKGVARRINNMTIRFPARWSHYYESNYEEDNYTLLRQHVKAGMHLLDIGAHIGLFSAACSQLAGPQGKIICFEPTPGTFSVLKETLRLNHCENVTALQAAVGDKEGTATFYVGSLSGSNTNSLVKNESVKEFSEYDVRLVTIDGIVSQYSLKPSLIKIDAEGAELDVLKGGARTFTDHKPVLILGLHPAFIKKKGDSLEAIWDLLQAQRYIIKMESKNLTKQDFCSHELIFDVHCF
jgi:FkbM family methyltransferase